jgi:hypothetical protein
MAMMDLQGIDVDYLRQQAFSAINHRGMLRGWCLNDLAVAQNIWKLKINDPWKL